MAKKKNVNHGGIFEQSVLDSCEREEVFSFRVRDVFIPFDLRHRVRTPKNKYDYLIFNNGHLFPVELKTTQNKSISIVDEGIIRQHQILSLKEATKYENVIPGFIFNFREYDNQTFFVHIDDFIEYGEYATSQKPHPYKVREGKKLNKSSISLDICQEIGVEVMNVVKRVRYHYFITHMTDELISKYGHKH